MKSAAEYVGAIQIKIIIHCKTTIICTSFIQITDTSSFGKKKIEIANFDGLSRDLGMDVLLYCAEYRVVYSDHRQIAAIIPVNEGIAI